MAWEHKKFVETPVLIFDLVKEKLENPYSIEYRIWSFNDRANMNRSDETVPRGIKRRHLI